MDYRQRPAPTTDEETYPFISEAKEGSKIVPIGPLHVTSDEPGHFRLFVDGEDIIVHRVPLDGIVDFVAAKRAEGCGIDVRVAMLLAGGLLAV